MSFQPNYTEKFIACVKKYPIIYDTGHRNFTNIEKRAEAWEDIAIEMNERSSVLRLKWKSLKYGYTKYKDRKTEECKGKATYSTTVVNWCWGPHLQFLDNYNIKRRSKPKMRTLASNSYASVPASSNTHPQLELQDTMTSQEDDNLLVEIPSTLDSPTSSTRTSEVSSKVPENRTIATNTEDGIGNILNFTGDKQKPHTDAVDDLFQSYAKTFKKFSVQTQIMLKVNMAKLFAQAELREHNNMNQIRFPVHLFDNVDSDIKTESSFDFELNDATESILSDE